MGNFKEVSLSVSNWNVIRINSFKLFCNARWNGNKSLNIIPALYFFCFIGKPLDQFRSKNIYLATNLHSLQQNDTFEFPEKRTKEILEIWKFTWLRINMRLSEEQFRRNSWTCKCYTALLPSWGENIPENCARKIFPEFQLSESFAHFVVGGSVLSTGSKYLETANMSPEQTKTVLQKKSRANKCAQRNILNQQICHEQTNVLQKIFINNKCVTSKKCAPKNRINW